jgi:hypothetical protein
VTAAVPRWRRAIRWLLALLLLGLLSLASLVGGYVQLGYTPGRLMDYAERRLEGHVKLESVALPVIGALRTLLDEPSLSDRLNRPFHVPQPPPPLRSRPDEVTTRADVDAKGRRVWRVGPDEAIRHVSDVARRARDGDTVEIVAADYHGDVAVWLQRRLIIRGVGGNARLYADGRSAEGKAIWVFRNGDFEVSNIDFIGARVDDRNGAGIRFENGHLVVRNCLFWGGESGLMTSNGAAARLEIEGSEFGYNGDGEGLSHHVYVGSIGSFRVTGSYFHHGNVGHLIKSRAALNEIQYNRITDEQGGRASYEVDLPNGGIAVLIGNVIQQSRETENSTLISYGQEGYKWPENRLDLMNNTLVNDHPYGGAFLRAAPGAGSIVLANNVRSGPGRYHTADPTQTLNDVTGDRSLFVDAGHHDYRLSESGRRIPFQKPVVSSYRNLSLEPRAEYVHPRQLRFFNEPPVYPGAVQSLPQ